MVEREDVRARWALESRGEATARLISSSGLGVRLIGQWVVKAPERHDLP
jgi:hypothetical protein